MPNMTEPQVYCLHIIVNTATMSRTLKRSWLTQHYKITDKVKYTASKAAYYLPDDPTVQTGPLSTIKLKNKSKVTVLTIKLKNKYQYNIDDTKPLKNNQYGNYTPPLIPNVPDPVNTSIVQDESKGSNMYDINIGSFYS